MLNVSQIKEEYFFFEGDYRGANLFSVEQEHEIGGKGKCLEL